MKEPMRRRGRGQAQSRGPIVLLCLQVFVLSGCAAAPIATLGRLTAPPCPPEAPLFDWFGPSEPRQRERHTDWCESVGRAIAIAPSGAVPPVDLSRDGLIVVSWNMRAGAANIEDLMAYLHPASAPAPRPPVIILAQEAMRGGEAVPISYPKSVKPPRRSGGQRSRLADASAIAQELGLSVAYAPSMRNGRKADEREDRGSAIFSTLPLTNPVAIELPWVRQRRVVVAATIEVFLDNQPLRMRVMSVHLDNRPGRKQQSAALAALLPALEPAMPIVIGGDLNTWFGGGEETVRQIDAVVPRVRECGDEATFRFRRHLDYVFTTFSRDVRRGCEIVGEKFGSDHRPTILRLFGPAP